MEAYKINFSGDLNKSQLASKAVEKLPQNTFKKNNLEAISADDEDISIEVVANGSYIQISTASEKVNQAYAPKGAEDVHIDTKEKGTLFFKFGEAHYKLTIESSKNKR